MHLVLILKHAKEAHMDVLFIGMAIALFGVSWLLTELIERI